MILLIDDPRHRVAEDGTARLSLEQARAILDLRLQRLTALGRDEIAEELDKLAVEIADYLDILRSRARVQTIVKDELVAVKTEFATPRRNRDHRPGRRGRRRRPDPARGHGGDGIAPRLCPSASRCRPIAPRSAEARVAPACKPATRISSAACSWPPLTHRCCFSRRAGMVYKEKVWRLPMAAPNARGKAFINILSLEQGERITTIMPLPEDEASWGNLDVMFATTGGKRPAQQIVRLRRRAPLRHDRHEAR